MSFDRFDFEQAIMIAWSGTDDLGLVLEAMDDGASQDEIRNMLIGIKFLQDRKFRKVFSMLEAGVAERKIL